MKKTLSLLFAIVFAAVAICTLTISAFADETTTAEAETTTEAAETTTEAAETTTEVDLGDPRDTTKATEEPRPSGDPDKTLVVSAVVTENNSSAGDDVVTNPSGVTSIDDGDETTKTPAPVDDDIPSTGSGIVVPAVALLALAGGVAVAVKSKKD